MTAKEWLLRARGLSYRVRALQSSKARAFARATSAAVSDGEHVPGGAPADHHAAYAALSVEVDRQLAALAIVRAEILQVIGQVEDNTLAAILTEYYVNDRTWKEVAEGLRYATRHVLRLHGQALRVVQEILARREDVT